MAKRPEPSEPVVKTLFALSRNVCAFSDSERGEDYEQRLTDPAWKRVRARICHIRGLLPDSARHDASMTDVARNAYENLILMCPNHHNLIDDLEPDRYSVDVLTEMKQRAELHGGAATAWADDEMLSRLARSAIAAMRQTWWGRRYSPIVRARQIQVGTVIDYNGEPVEISDVVRRADGHSVHLTFAEQIENVVGWDLDDDDPLNIHTF